MTEQPKCPRCGRSTSGLGLCDVCEDALSLEDTGLDDPVDSEYTERLADGFALMRAAELPGEYNRRWG